MNIADTLADPELFEPWFPGETWDGWRAVLKAAYALPMTGDEVDFFRTVAQRDAPKQRVRELWCIVGRRGGKDSVASVIAAHSAALFSEGDRLRPGERALVMCLAVDRDQAKVVLNYTRSFFTDIPLLQHMVERETATGFELSNKIDITIATNSFRSVRGRPILCAILDETAFWRDENSATPDEETYKAIKPALASIPSSIIIGISSPYRRSGLLYKKYRDHYGKNGDVLVIQAPTRTLNPTIPQDIVDEAMAEDSAAASAEWMAEFRDDISAFVSREAVEACVSVDVFERAAVRGVTYAAAVDPSGGSSDSMTLAIGHRQDDEIIVDAVREHRPPFSPEDVVVDHCAVLQAYNVTSVRGDRYAGEWPRERFREHGISYELAPKAKSDLYRDLLPVINSRRLDLLDHRKLITQLCSLERRTARGGRDSIDHPPGGGSHDDLANVVALVVDMLTGSKGYDSSMSWVSGPDDDNDEEEPMILTLRGNGRAERLNQMAISAAERQRRRRQQIEGK
jgi:hypothetical protein